MSRYSTTNIISSRAFAVASLLALLALVTLVLKSVLEWRYGYRWKGRRPLSIARRQCGQQALRRFRRAQRMSASRPKPGEFLALLGPVGLGQDDAAADHGRARIPRRRHGPVRRRGRHRHSASRDRGDRLRLPALCPVPAHDRRRQRRLRADRAKRRRRARRGPRSQRRVAGAARPRPARPTRQALPGPALGRPAPARGAGPRARRRAASCCCSTSRSARSTPRSARSCAAGCATCTTGWA